MQLHHRHHKVAVATGTFAMAWAKNEDGIKTYGDAAYVLSQVDAFWINAFRKETPIATALAEWDGFDATAIDLGSTIKSTGDFLASLIRVHELTYGEINSILMKSRNTDAGYLLRAERGSDDLDHENGHG